MYKKSLGQIIMLDYLIVYMKGILHMVSEQVQP